MSDEENYHRSKVGQAAAGFLAGQDIVSAGVSSAVVGGLVAASTVLERDVAAELADRTSAPRTVNA